MLYGLHRSFQALKTFPLAWVASIGGGTREAGSTVAESLLVVPYRVGTHQIRRRQRAVRSLMSQGRAEPLCVRIKGANREVSEGKANV